MTDGLAALVAEVDRVMADPGLIGERARAEALVPAMKTLLADPGAVPEAAGRDLDGQAVGNLLHADPGGRFHVMAVVFPEGTSSGVHHHGCWGVIGYLRGGDEETRYAGPPEGPPAEVSRHVWHQGDVTFLLPEEGEGWHRVRNPGPGTGVSIHVLCRLPGTHPHLMWDRSRDSTRDYPFLEVAPDRWRAQPA